MHLRQVRPLRGVDVEIVRGVEVLWGVECYEYLRGRRKMIATATHNVRAMG